MRSITGYNKAEKDGHNGHKEALLERTSHIASQLAVALGQNEALLTAIEHGEVHPAMVAFGLWRDDADLADLADRIAENRVHQTPRLVPEL